MESNKKCVAEFANIFNNIATLKKDKLKDNNNLFLRLDELITTLASQKLSIKITITEKLCCIKCKARLSNKVKLTILPCFHSICSNCLKEQIDKALEKKGDMSLLRNTTCPTCQELIPEAILTTVFNKKDFDEIIKTNGLLCVICNNGHQLKELILLNCGHLINRNCLGSYVRNQIDKGVVEEATLSCRVEGCGKPLCAYEILEIINSTAKEETKTQLESKLRRIRIKLGAPINNEQIFICPKCDYPQVLNVNEPELACPSCHTIVCPACGDAPHPGVNCSDNMMNNRNEEEIEEMMKKQRLKYCPSCKSIVFKNTGCNFVYCSSAKCKGKRMFCNNCGLKVYNRDHGPHFLGNPSGTYCKVAC